jgi:hypothetical protein
MAEPKKTTGAQSGLPATEESENRKYMSAGLHTVKIKAILQNVKKVGDKEEIILDKKGNPSCRIVFVNKAGEEIEGTYFFSQFPAGDARRKDERFVCKSEFKLHHLKQALGFGTAQAPEAEVKKKKIWLAVAHQIVVDSEGNQLFKDNKPRQYSIVKEVYPYNDKATDEGRPELVGDPQTDPDNFKTGFFFEKKTDSGAAKPASSEIAEETTTSSETPVSESDMPPPETGGNGANDW